MNRYLLTEKGLVRQIPAASIGTEMEKEYRQAFQTRLTRAVRMERYLTYWYFQRH